jgi:2-hydroxy-4-carboxymuconate semialdehyde hemiacetal dehydrogenase
MMGVWHSEAIRNTPHRLHAVVGPREEPVADFARQYGYRRWMTDLDAALRDEDVDVVVLASPSEFHAHAAHASIAAGKHTLVEIPIAMTLVEAEQIVAAAESAGVILAVCHPMRVRPEMSALRSRLQAGEETVHHVCGRFFIRRLENVGATGYHRSWTDNLLWHHMAHLIDFGCWMVSDVPSRILSSMPAPHPRTGIPMDCAIVAELPHGTSILAVGSYLGHERLYETLVITDRDSYRLDILHNVLTTSRGATNVASEQENCALVVGDFLEAVEQRRPPAVTGASVLPAMRILHEVQNQWDGRFGRRALPGRPLAP